MNITDLKNLKRLNGELELQKDELATRKELFDKRTKSLIETIAETTKKIVDQKVGLTKEALDEYEITKVKKFACGIGIRETKKISYNAEEAFTWAMTSKMCLQLDKKKFEKVAPELVDFITITKNPSVTFPAILLVEETEVIK